jgi:hypothetical protein
VKKNNLSPGNLGRVLCRFCFVGFLLALLAGCSAPPSSVERYFFDLKTNLVPVVKLTTNIVERVESSTNEVGAVLLQPVRETVILSATNYAADIVMSPSPAFKSWAALASGVAEVVSPGSGSLLGLGLLGGASMYGLNRRRKWLEAETSAGDASAARARAEILSENLAQGVEIAREVIKTTPQGAALNRQLVEVLQRNQVAAGVIRDAALIVSQTVDNEKAKRAAELIREIVPAGGAS